MVFSWGDNTPSQHRFDSQINNIDNPKIIFKNIFIKDISLGNNHSMILTNGGEVLIFGDNQFNQCNTENKSIIKLSENDDIIPINEINYYISQIEYLIKNNEKITYIEVKNDCTMIITDKKSIIFRGKIFETKEKIFKLTNNSQNLNTNKNINSNDNINNIYIEIKNLNNSINNCKRKKFYNNSNNKSQKKII